MSIIKRHCRKCGRNFNLPIPNIFNSPRFFCIECVPSHWETLTRKADKEDINECTSWYLIREVVIKHYSPKVECALCGYNIDQRALSIDHINGNGNKHRKEIGKKAGADFYRWLRDNNFPPGFRVLCANCQITSHRDREFAKRPVEYGRPFGDPIKVRR